MAFSRSTQCWQPRMALVAGQRSTLNPNAPLYIPAAFRQVEDFSPKWWELVKTSTWFRDYWLSELKEDDFVASAENVATKDALDWLPEFFDVNIEDDYLSLEAEFEELVLSCESEDIIDSPTTENIGKARNGLNLDAKALLKDMFSSSPRHGATKSPGGSPKYYEKPVQHVAVKCSPRRIQQPR